MQLSRALMGSVLESQNTEGGHPKGMLNTDQGRDSHMTFYTKREGMGLAW